MEYYILDEVAGNPDIPYIGELPEQIDMIEVVMGKEYSFDLPIRLPVTIQDESEVVYPDMMTADIPLFSKRLKNKLDDLGIDNINYFPVELFDEESGEVVAHYYLGIISGLIKCLKSGIEINPSGRRMIKNPVIDSDLADGQLFRLYESPRLIIIDTYIKEGIEEAGLQGISITRLKDYISL
ncbi:imm11 family protein [Flavobacterium hydrophilum]|uniref:Immunity MXAN-0049 protein domain-containing protein n=1 Tax=Flavobacterium hydrophilum TaxID=2211445 RepID=A0A2V4CAL2_9FLAO|nr:DUF1629 domain-containing protein [Flavobacterium hydrophilum]PXY46990.1 hypothetical protein DMB68_07540 [Flavobacterium hydrophilum]